MTNFPTSLDVLVSPGPNDPVENAVAALDHDVQHRGANEAIMALQAKVGVNGSAVPGTLDFRTAAVEGRATTLEGRATAVEGRATALEAVTTGPAATTAWQGAIAAPFVPYPSDASYTSTTPYRLWQGEVHLRGIYFGGNSSILCTLPVGMRPLINLIFECRSSVGPYEVRVYAASGAVQCLVNVSAAGAWASVGNVRFIAEQ